MGKKYDKEFRENAVEHLLVSGKTLKQVSDDLGCSKSALAQWKNIYKGNASKFEISKDEELMKLRKENKNLIMERDILKKSIGIFSRTQ